MAAFFRLPCLWLTAGHRNTCLSTYLYKREFNKNKVRLSSRTSCLNVTRVIAMSKAPKQSRRTFTPMDCFALRARNDVIKHKNKARLSFGPETAKGRLNTARVIARSEAPKQSRRAFALQDCFARQFASGNLPNARNDSIEHEFFSPKSCYISVFRGMFNRFS
jgi:hypothetical protein